MDTTATTTDSTTSSQTDPPQAFEQAVAKDLLAALKSYETATSTNSSQVTA